MSMGSRLAVGAYPHTCLYKLGENYDQGMEGELQTGYFQKSSVKLSNSFITSNVMNIYSSWLCQVRE